MRATSTIYDNKLEVKKDVKVGEGVSRDDRKMNRLLLPTPAPVDTPPIALPSGCLRKRIREKEFYVKFSTDCYNPPMILTFHEGECIRASAGDTTLVFGPVSKSSKNFKPTNFGADVAFVSLNHSDMNGIEEAGRGDKKPFAIIGPGEYEVKGVVAAAFGARSKYGGEEKINTIYAIDFDGLSILYLGALSDPEMPKEVFEMDAPDILILPIGGGGVLSPSDAQKLAVKLEAKIVIPVHYDAKSLKVFLKEAGAEDVKPVDKLTLKAKDVAGKENDVVVLQS